MISRRIYMYELSTVLMALGHDDVNDRNAGLVAQFLSTELIQALVNDTIDHGVAGGIGIPNRGTVIGWSGWWLDACKKELEHRIEMMLLI